MTKTKPSHFKPAVSKAAGPTGPRMPTSPSGQLLANEINASKSAPDVKARLLRETVEHEDTHGQVTQTFVKKTRKLLKS